MHASVAPSLPAGSLKGAAPAPGKDHRSHPAKLAVSPSMDHLLSLSTSASRAQSSASLASVAEAAEGPDGAAAAAALLGPPASKVPWVLPR